MAEEETNSLLKLLAIDSPAKLPQSLKLSDDSSLILQAIRELGDVMLRNFRKNRHQYNFGKSNLQRIILPNGDRVGIGDHLYDIKCKHEFGEVVGISGGTLVVNSPSGTVEFIDPEKAVHLTVMPF